ncbi:MULTISPECIES: FAD-dependent monooxygenase [unclassified Agrobacterium]|uniref:FAD-dependent monooxygenase n=1 Tax=unclassified Agrobacterium TaxID=2632611 RepID=UPI00244701C9|nr:MULTISPECIES: FAD-dependent monooxygenase [unclassified Agrobacterium]MDH0612116.1 FAD-dependent monooxygenase [Agrobacterium sp. GD03872]MDH0696013.1 FAD-dependent monooxygenase [Agrobacterium sp. GD03871]MDH1058713.1 FAD-dependent monooxygenase [Agrobacterium sp. GD03992]MDH2210804.1 FAD-dependent monooxygenase [Agrobacterium sp. GD03643]MDH2217779.1 FAD-dependent monooxygenase [Agrobacterium sp. GD03638]
MVEKRDVIVVGGGPVGLWISCELRLAGLSVVVLERRNERINQSRALTIHGRSVEMFSLRGLEERFIRTGIPIPTGHYAVLDTRLGFDFIDSKFPYTLFLPQDATEAILEQRALELGVEVVRGATVDKVDIEEDAVSVHAEGKDGPLAYTGSYVIGADGTRSLVRQSAGIAFEGQPASGMWFMGDVVLGDPPKVPVLSEFNMAGCAMIAPLGDGRHWRIVLNEAEDRGKTRADPVTLEELKTATRNILGSDLGARDPLWLSRFDNETRLAAHYRKGRAFLAGDAAHIHLPAGGQGMNVGLQDAMNLGWKLAMVMKGEAPETLLDSYEQERRPIGLYLHDTTMAQAALITAFSPHGLALRGVMNDMLKVPAINQYFALQVSGFGVHYPLPLPGDVMEPAGGLTGTRIRDVELHLENGVKTTLFSLLSDGRWLSLSLDAVSRASVPSWVPAHAIVTATGRPAEPMPTLERLAAITLRPDGYVAGFVERRTLR